MNRTLSIWNDLRPFSIGFGKELFGINDKNGTRWKFCLIPLGGYVKFFGDRNVFSQTEQEELLKKYNDRDKKKLFVIKPLYQRSLIVFGGPLANFVLAILIFTLIYMFSGKDFTPAKISEVQENGIRGLARGAEGEVMRLRMMNMGRQEGRRSPKRHL